MAVLVALLIGCMFLVVGCSSGVRSEAPKQQGQAKVTEKEEQEHTEATREEQGSSPKAAAEAEQCAGTRTVDLLKRAGVHSISDSSVQPGDPEARFTTNDLPGCPNGGLLEGTDESDKLAGEYGEDEVRGLGAKDTLSGGGGGDVLYGGPGNDELQAGAGLMGADPFTERSNNALHGGAGKDFLAGAEGDDVIYGGEGDDKMLWEAGARMSSMAGMATTI
jgi:Ca2+-binding RTX toxin-like protein